jgi:cytochrome c551
VRTLSVLIPTALAAIALSACGSEGVSVPETDAVAHEGAEIFATHCAGCHTISAAGTQGSGNRLIRAQGPNFNQRVETYDEALFAIHNGGFSGAIMPQNIVVGDEAAAVAEFLAKYSGTDVEESPRPQASNDTEGSSESDTAADDTAPQTSGDDSQLGQSGSESGDAGASGGDSSP